MFLVSDSRQEGFLCVSSCIILPKRKSWNFVHGPSNYNLFKDNCNICFLMWSEALARILKIREESLYLQRRILIMNTVEINKKEEDIIMMIHINIKRRRRHLSFTLTFRTGKDILQYFTIFWKCLIHLSENVYGIKYIPSICQSYINTILGCLETRKHFEAIMDDLLLFTSTKEEHMAKLEDLLKALLKNGLKILPNSASYLRQNYNIWEIQYL